jgi:epoxyqueuosine reductase
MMKTAIRKRALELGFDDCRFTAASPPDHAAEFEKWLGQNRHGEMSYLARNADKRLNPQRVLSGAKSVIALAVSYATGVEGRVAGVEEKAAAQPEPTAGGASVLASQWAECPVDLRPGSKLVPPDVGCADRQEADTHGSRFTFHGIVARYARFADYHNLVGERLQQLAGYVNELGGGTRSLGYVDTGPVLERDLAQRAGLGFIGKHTNLISRQLGNWVFLAEIVTTLELEPDAPEKNRCGSCTRCIAACPTAAIPAPFQLDARRCISYLTIELKGSIPVELRPLMGNRIFGCDDCLAVCPWNRFAREGGLMKEHARSDLTTPDLLELLALDETGFKRRFAGTPILRTKRRGLLRNVCVALGNTGDASALTALQRAATEPEPLIGEHARWAMGEIQRRTRG